MNRKGKIAVLVTITIAFVMACVSTGPAVVEKVRKERTEISIIPYVTKETVTFGDGLLDRTIFYAYSEGGKRLLTTTTMEPSRTEPTEKLAYEYSGEKLISLTNTDYNGAVVAKTEYETDAQGHLVKETVFGPKQLIQTISLYAYDSSGQRIEWRILSATGAVKAITRYVLENGRVSKILMLDSSEQATGTIVNTYDSANLLFSANLIIKKEYLGKGGAIEKTEEFKYDAGRLVEEIRLRGDGKVERRQVREYNASGNLIKLITFDGSALVREIRTYEYASREESRIVVYYE